MKQLICHENLQQIAGTIMVTPGSYSVEQAFKKSSNMGSIIGVILIGAGIFVASVIAVANSNNGSLNKRTRK